MRRLLLVVLTLYIGVAPIMDQVGRPLSIPLHIQLGSNDLAIPWFVPWIIAFVATELVKLRTVGGQERRWQRFVRKQASVLAGLIEAVGCALMRHPAAEAQALKPGRIEAGLLQGVVNIARSLTNADESISIQASLLVPGMERRARGIRLFLEVVNRNEVLGSRGMRRHALAVRGPAQIAFTTGKPQVVPDTAKPPYNSIFKDRPYKSVVAFPIRLETHGGTVGVVSIDASEPNLFTAALLDRGLQDTIDPYLKLLGSLRLFTKLGGDHGANDDREAGERVAAGRVHGDLGSPSDQV